MFRSVQLSSTVVGVIVPIVAAMHWVAPRETLTRPVASADGTCELHTILKGGAVKYSAKDSTGATVGYAVLAFHSYQLFVNSNAATACADCNVRSIKLSALRGVQTVDDVVNLGSHVTIDHPGNSVDFGVRLPLVAETRCTVVVEYEYTLVPNPKNSDSKYLRRLGVFDLANASEAPMFVGAVTRKSGSRIVISPPVPYPPPKPIPPEPPPSPQVFGIESVTIHGCSASFSSSQHLALYNVSFAVTSDPGTQPNVTSIQVKAAANYITDPNSSAWINLPLNVPPSALWEQDGIQGRYDGSSQYSLQIIANYSINGTDYSDWVIGHFADINAHLSTWIDMDS
jgi:hypothetical protein